MTFQQLTKLLRTETPHAEFLRGGALSLILKLGHTLLALVLAVLLARTLGPAGYGIYAYVFALVSLLAIPAQFGLPSLVVRETAKAQAGQNWGLMLGVWRWATRMALFFSLVLIVAGAVVAWTFADRLSETSILTFAWGLALVPLLVLAHLRAAALRGLNRIRHGLLSEFWLRPALFIIMVLAFLSWSGREFTAAAAMSLHVLAAAVVLLAATLWLHRLQPAVVTKVGKPHYETGKWLRSAFPLAFISGMQLINTKADILILGIFASTETVGIYQVAVSGANVVILGLSAINLVVAPQFSRLHSQAQMDRLQRLVTWSARAALVFTLPVVLVVLLFGGPLVRLIFGASYEPAYSPLAILAIGQLVNAGFGSVAILHNMTHHERVTARGVAIAAIVNISLNLILIPRFGMNGAATATAVSLVVWNVLLWRSAKRLLSINSLAFGRNPSAADSQRS